MAGFGVAGQGLAGMAWLGQVRHGSAWPAAACISEDIEKPVAA
jgi:hypothetical protein